MYLDLHFHHLLHLVKAACWSKKTQQKEEVTQMKGFELLLKKRKRKMVVMIWLVLTCFVCLFVVVGLVSLPSTPWSKPLLIHR